MESSTSQPEIPVCTDDSLFMLLTMNLSLKSKGNPVILKMLQHIFCYLLFSIALSTRLAKGFLSSSSYETF